MCAVLSLRRGSHRPIEVTCELAVSPKCRRQWRIEERLADETRARNEGRVICVFCSRQTKNVGRGNPNAKYLSLDDHYFEKVDSEIKAYLLGWIASDGSIKKNSLSIYVHRKDEGTLRTLRDSFCSAIPIKHKKSTALVGFTINAQRVVTDVCRWLDVVPGKKSGVVGMPLLANDALGWAFIRGVFDGDGSISSIDAAYKRASTRRGWPAPRCSISNTSTRLLDAIAAFTKIPAHQSSDSLQWFGTNALDFLGKIYDGAAVYLSRKRDLYLDWCGWAPATNLKAPNLHPLFMWTRVCPEAVAPSKEFASDSGFDLTLIERTKTFGAVEFFRTGIRVQPAFGWYFDLVARSSISKTGYMLANSVGVIDRAYVGEILVPLIKVDPNAPDLPLPSRLIQIVPRQIIAAELIEVDELESTARGAGGFGSTNKPPA
jgi:deoxyuridine 5'-triphosphate nucleotidohydrolase